MESFRRVLLKERDRLLEELRKLDEQDETGGEAGETGELSHYDQHMADQGTELFLREQDQAIELGFRGSLDQVEKAIHKLDRGSYGYCDRCGDAIPEERLEIFPAAIYCMRCADELQSRF
jgi:RNA polymerase-binding transcription factor DksA